MPAPLDPATAYAAVAGRDARWDGRLYLGVATTGIYCRPSCPARTPRPENCQYFPTAAAAVAAGFRACRRCRPDALPGTRHWDARGDLVGRAVRLISEGVLDDGGVPALARRLALSERHLTRLLLAEVGATPAGLARTRRAHAARLLIDQTSLPLTDVAFAAGFGSIRQFNDVMRAEFGMAPGELRRTTSGPTAKGPTAERTEGVDIPLIALRLAYRPPLALAPLRRTLAAHAVAGVEQVDEDGGHWRVIDAPTGPALARLDLAATGERADLPVSLRLSSLSDLMPVVARLRRWLDLDADPGQVAAHLGTDPLLAPLVARHPGLRVPGHVDGAELAVCAVLGQQVSLAAARTFQGRIVAAFGTPVFGTAAFGTAAIGTPAASETFRTFPRPQVLANAGPQAIRDAAHLTQARARAVHTLATTLAEGTLDLTPGADPATTRTTLLALPGIGPWTADYLALRALHDPDAFMPTDLVARKALAALTGRPLADVRGAVIDHLSTPWRPWRSYALHHLWTEAVYS